MKINSAGVNSVLKEFINSTEPIKTITESKILSFSKLDSGWCFGRGEQFLNSMLLEAIQITKLANNYGFLHTDAFPSENGEIMITLYRDRWYCEIQCLKNDLYNFILEFNDDEVESKEGINKNALDELLKSFRKKVVICEPSEYSTPFNMIPIKRDSKVTLSNSHLPIKEYLLWIKNVSLIAEGAFVDTSGNITVRYPEIPLSSGNFHRTICL